MIRHYECRDGCLTRCLNAEGNIQVLVGPGADEKMLLQDELGIDGHTIESALDPDEVSRLEVHRKYLYVVSKRPRNFTAGTRIQFDVASLGLVFQPERNGLVVIVGEDYQLEGEDLSDRYRIESTPDALLYILWGTVHYFLEHLKVIKMVAREIQNQLNQTMDNRLLIQMFSLSESLIFYSMPSA